MVLMLLLLLLLSLLLPLILLLLLLISRRQLRIPDQDPYFFNYLLLLLRTPTLHPLSSPGSLSVSYTHLTLPTIYSV